MQASHVARRRLSPMRIAGLVIAVGVVIAAWFFLDIPSLAVFRQWADSTGVWFPVFFWLLYVLITQLPVPRTIMTVSAGVLFGGGWAIIIALSATTVAAVISLIVVRFLLRDWVESRLRHPAVDSINNRLEERGWLAIASLRLVAFVPFSVLNYTAALSRVPIITFALATLIGSAPNTIIVTLVGDALAGGSNPLIVVVMVVLTIAGLVGLLIDARLPTHTHTHTNSPTERAEVSGQA